MRCINRALISLLFLLLIASPAFATGALTPAATDGGGLPAAGSEGDCLLTSSGVWGSGACPGAGSGAPTDAQYWTAAANGTLSAERNLGALGTGLVINTSGVPSIYAGVTCTNQVVRILGASGAGTCATITSAFVDTSIWTGTVSSGLLKATSQGVLAQATAGTDYVIPAGNVATATALAANGSNCSAGQFPLGVNASGVVESCTSLLTALAALDASTVALSDDFSSGSTSNTTIGRLGWAASGGTSSAQNSEINHPGILRRDTSTSSGTVAYTSLATLGGFLPTAATTQDETWRVRLNVNDTDTGMRVGSMANINVDPGNQIGFEKEVADTNFFCVTKNTTETRTDSGVAVDTNFHAFRYVRAGTTQVEFYLDGVLRCTHTTNLPSAATIIMPTAQVFNGAAASKTMDLDHFTLIYSGMVR